jgi:hypothetical protein
MNKENKCKIEFRQARTGLQESDGFIVLGLKDLPILLADHRVVQHGAAVLSSETEVSGYGECWLCTRVNEMHVTQQTSSLRPCRRWRPGPYRARS